MTVDASPMGGSRRSAEAGMTTYVNRVGAPVPYKPYTNAYVSASGSHVTPRASFRSAPGAAALAAAPPQLGPAAWRAGSAHSSGLSQRPSLPPRAADSMPDPESIDQQKSTYAASLDGQLEQGTRMIEQQGDIQKQALRHQAEQQIQQFRTQMDQELRAQEMSVDQQASVQLMSLQQAAAEQRAVLEQQANAAVLEYEQKRIQDDFALQQYEHQRRAHERHAEIEAEKARQREHYAAQARMTQEAYAAQEAALRREAAEHLRLAAQRAAAGPPAFGAPAAAEAWRREESLGPYAPQGAAPHGGSYAAGNPATYSALPGTMRLPQDYGHA